MNEKQFNFFKCSAVLLTIIVLSGCFFFAPKVNVDGLVLDVALQANDDSPVAVDFIAVNDVELLKQLSGLTAKQWFAERNQFQRDFRQHISVWGLELVPGQLIESGIFPLDGKPAVGLLVFANYNNPGPHRLRLEGERKIWLKFDSRDMTLLDENAH
ncbi:MULTISPECIES: type VI secretion protein [unclassified Pseudomonas]|uniref:type VI secretion protein n=1 Tax=unclassified Pseudomonas TaxID=196821 RepID=UPI002B23AA79|nr:MULTISPECIES: type VI secretion protein [unclassified Pseudomonas]MEA9977317.1 type VI secretion protein [Pseudomonas sp. RTS4]MEB0199615.1 type VI secretion protein [Pseudomonas sp. 5S4]MEB0245237.1 type VI secretion protein [Pseudomonas sp. 10S5]